MNEKPIIFSTEMVRAILKNQKTMTRRVMIPQPPECVDHFFFYDGELRAHLPIWEPCVTPGGVGIFRIKPRYNIGDRLWVRETWDIVDQPVGTCARESVTIYKADPQWYPYVHKWKSGRYMPRIWARLFLEVTDIKAERLQDISQIDAIEEGLLYYEGWQTREYKKALAAAVAAGTKPPLGFSTKQRYLHLWDKLNKKRGYGVKVNPWVIVYSFKRADHADTAGK
jgi:hypothetical protein